MKKYKLEELVCEYSLATSRSAIIVYTSTRKIALDDVASLAPMKLDMDDLRDGFAIALCDTDEAETLFSAVVSPDNGGFYAILIENGEITDENS